MNNETSSKVENVAEPKVLQLEDSTQEQKFKFYQHALNFFNTSPKREELQCKEEVKESLLEKFSVLKAKVKHLWISDKIGDESNDDYEHFHVLHLLVKLDHQIEVKSEDFWDLNNIHVHYTNLGAVRARVKEFYRKKTYCCKKNGYFLEDKENPEIQEESVFKSNSIVALTTYLMDVVKIKKRWVSSSNSQLKAIINQLNAEMASLYHLNKSHILKAISNAGCGDNVPTHTL